VMVELFPAGFEEVEREGAVELAAYTDAGGEERVWHVFGGGTSTEVEQGWEDRWRAFHRPARVGRLWIGPPWEQAPAGAVAVVIDPGRAFGTGAHATTRLCLELLQELEPGPLLDVGSGSGVLAIAAASLGWTPVTAVDVEQAAIAATRGNARANGVDVEALLVAADGELPPLETAVANISHEAIRSVAPRLRSSRLIASGYLESDPSELPGWMHLERRTQNGWALDAYRR
jgi:ribosomal protein L11 methyltransferase